LQFSANCDGSDKKCLRTCAGEPKIGVLLNVFESVKFLSNPNILRFATRSEQVVLIILVYVNSSKISIKTTIKPSISSCTNYSIFNKGRNLILIEKIQLLTDSIFGFQRFAQPIK